ncbi:MAG TPA: S8 family serine peptidase [Gaiellaceae bacterium]|nr:S8 family serine peptidase [Gaiellaceae bacterium]
MRRAVIVAAAAVAALTVAALAAARPAAPQPTTFVVVYESGVSKADARAAVQAAGGRVVRENAKVGVATVVSRNPNFLRDAAAARALYGAARNRPVGRVARPTLKPTLKPRLKIDIIGSLRKAPKARPLAGAKLAGGPGAGEPLADRQWDMRMINATAEGSYRFERGHKKVLVGVLDTGVDGSHPDIAENFDRGLSRNFTVDIPVDVNGRTIDGPCADEPDQSCNDPADVDENSHGTHVASTIASPINKLGMAGVAPEVTIVNIRAGQDSGFFFLQPSVDALVYAGDHGIDVVNMSYFIDPWWMNCPDNPADSPVQQAEQRTIMVATQRAVDYAHARDVTLIAAEGNEDTDLGHPTTDSISPDFPLVSAKTRTVNNTCKVLPTEADHVMSISSLGPTERKADYSNYGLEQTTVAAPGGYFRDDPWHPGLLPTTSPQSRVVGVPNQILAAFPLNVAEEAGVLNPDGTPNTISVVRDCAKGTCAYYQWIQGTSMASPHAVGVAALIVAKHGRHSPSGITMDPDAVEDVLTETARDHPCPTPALHSYADKGRGPSFTALCEGDAEFNGFYGHGIVDALAAVH